MLRFPIAAVNKFIWLLLRPLLSILSLQLLLVLMLLLSNGNARHAKDGCYQPFPLQMLHAIVDVASFAAVRWLLTTAFAENGSRCKFFRYKFFLC